MGDKYSVLHQTDIFSYICCLLDNSIPAAPANEHSLPCVVCLGVCTQAASMVSHRCAGGHIQIFCTNFLCLLDTF